MVSDAVPAATVYPAPVQPKPWGREVVFAAVEGRYVGKLIHVDAGHSLSTQYHREKEETICLVSGEAIVEHGPDAGHLTAVRFRPGDTIHLPAGVVHRIEAVTDIVFAECSTAPPGWRHDVVRLADAYGRTGTVEP
jgi:mannose-6-phosphate isomerase-like protein (cupin superfamily)